MGAGSTAAIVSGSFALIQTILEYLKTVDVSEEVIAANWDETRNKVFSRPSDALPEVPE